MAITRFGLTIEAQTRGEEQLRRLEQQINSLHGKSQKFAKESGADFGDLGEKIREGIRNPMDAARDASEGLLQKLGPTGVALGVVGTAAAAAGAAVFTLAKSFADAYEQQANQALRLGVTIRDYRVLADVAKDVGLEQDILAATTKQLAEAVADGAEGSERGARALRRLGVSAVDAFGALRPMKSIVLEIADGIGAITDPAERARRAVEVFGRRGVELLPLMTQELRNQVVEAEKLIEGYTLGAEAIAKSTDEVLTRFERRWNESKKRVDEFGASMFLSVASPSDYRDILLKEAQAIGGKRAFLANRAAAVGSGGAVPYVADPHNPFGLARAGVAGVSDDQLSAAALQARRARVSRLTGTDLSRQLTEARRDLENAIKEADVEGVISLQAAVRSLEARIEAARKAEAGATFVVREEALLRQGGAGRTGPAPTLFRAGERWAQFRISQGPSLLRDGESGNSGMFGLDPAVVARQREQQLITEQQLTDFQSRRLELLAGPGGEIAAIQTATQLRLDSLERQAALTSDLTNLDRDRLQAVLDGELRILEVQRRRKEEMRAEGGAIFDSITAGGGGMRRYISGLGLGIGRRVFSNFFAETMTGMQGKLALPGQGEPGAPNFLGKILQGTPFGMDPMKTATDLNTQATVANTAALTNLSGAVSTATTATTIGGPAVVPGGAPGAAPSKGGLGGMTRGLATAGVLAGGTFGIMSGIRGGGARGAFTAAGSAGGMVAGLSALFPAMSAAGPWGAAIAMGASMVAAMLPDPRESRRRELDAELQRRRVDDPVGTSYTSDIYGRSIDYDRRGELRSITLNVYALDSQSIVDRAEDIGEAVRVAFDRLPTLAPAARQAILGTA